jgi:hypothetical protein
MLLSLHHKMLNGKLIPQKYERETNEAKTSDKNISV